MAISTEVLNTTYRRLKGPLVKTFLRRTPFLDEVYKKGKVRMKMSGGTTCEYAIMNGSPTTGRGIFNGFELLNLTRAKRIQQLKVEPHRIAAAIAIPGRELDQNTGDAAVMRLIEEYPEAFMKSTDLCLEAFILTSKVPSGNHAFTAGALAGFTTLYGPWTSGKLTGTTNGIMQQAAPSAQSAKIHDVDSNDANKWINQYRAMASWSSEGEDKLGSLVRQCAQFSLEGRPDIGFVDPDTMTKMANARRSHVRIQHVEDKVEKTDQRVLEFNGVPFHESLDMDRSLFTGDAAANGWGYVLNLAYFDIPVVREAALDEFKDRTADQDGVVSKFLFHAAGPICRHRAAQGVFTGSAL